MIYYDEYNNDSTIRSDGTMIGDINLQGGTDVVDLRGGNFTGAIHGYGNMTLITDDASIKLTVDANARLNTSMRERGVWRIIMGAYIGWKW
ncbi:MAG: hypothetical protein EOO38_13235 [Cytophagaceae bacterium]|nr:MAG: hypothetical protein EOO38_13235 [Cytophagaceae bacterium]